jgi:hypothetical protein
MIDTPASAATSSSVARPVPRAFPAPLLFILLVFSLHAVSRRMPDCATPRDVCQYLTFFARVRARSEQLSHFRTGQICCPKELI